MEDNAYIRLYQRNEEALDTIVHNDTEPLPKGIVKAFCRGALKGALDVLPWIGAAALVIWTAEGAIALTKVLKK